MARPSTSDFLNAADAAYSSDPTGTSGLSLLTNAAGKAVMATKAADGFHGVAFETASGQVIVSFEGTDLGGLQTKPVFVGAQIQAAQQIYEGENPKLYADALRFTDRVEAAAAAQGISQSNVFVDGHSLGGAEAEYVAAQTGLAGDTFGAPGIAATDISPGEKSNLKNFVDYGDPVGNYSDNPNRVGNLLSGDDIERFGKATYVGQRSNALTLGEAGLLFGTSPVGTATAAGILVNATLDHHLIEDYAADLGVSLPGGGSGAGSKLTAADITGALSIILGADTGGNPPSPTSHFLGEIASSDHSGVSPIEQFLGSATHSFGHTG